MRLSHLLMGFLVISLVACGANQEPLPSPTPIPAPSLTPTATALPLTPDPAQESPPSPEWEPTALPPTPGTDANAQQAQSTLTITGSLTTVSPGETITVSGTLSGMGLPQYTLHLRDEPAIVVRYDNQLVFQGFTGEHLEFVSATATGSAVEFVLRALQPGEVQINLSASGEVAAGGGQGQPPAWSWGNVASDELIIQIQSTGAGP